MRRMRRAWWWGGLVAVGLVAAGVGCKRGKAKQAPAPVAVTEGEDPEFPANRGGRHEVADTVGVTAIPVGDPGAAPWLSFFERVSGSQRAEWEAGRAELGVTMERVWYQDADPELIVIYQRGRDLSGIGEKTAGSGRPLDVEITALAEAATGDAEEALQPGALLCNVDGRPPTPPNRFSVVPLAEDQVEEAEKLARILGGVRRLDVLRSLGQSGGTAAVATVQPGDDLFVLGWQGQDPEDVWQHWLGMDDTFHVWLRSRYQAISGKRLTDWPETGRMLFEWTAPRAAEQEGEGTSDETEGPAS